jgi:hypothetical protein
MRTTGLLLFVASIGGCALQGTEGGLDKMEDSPCAGDSTLLAWGDAHSTFREGCPYVSFDVHAPSRAFIVRLEIPDFIPGAQVTATDSDGNTRTFLIEELRPIRPGGIHYELLVVLGRSAGAAPPRAELIVTKSEHPLNPPAVEIAGTTVNALVQPLQRWDNQMAAPIDVSGPHLGDDAVVELLFDDDRSTGVHLDYLGQGTSLELAFSPIFVSHVYVIVGESTNQSTIGFDSRGIRHLNRPPADRGSSPTHIYQLGYDIERIILEFGEDHELSPFEDADIFEVGIYGQPWDELAALYNAFDLR